MVWPVLLRYGWWFLPKDKRSMVTGHVRSFVYRHRLKVLALAITGGAWFVYEASQHIEEAPITGRQRLMWLSKKDQEALRKELAGRRPVEDAHILPRWSHDALRAGIILQRLVNASAELQCGCPDWRMYVVNDVGAAAEPSRASQPEPVSAAGSQRKTEIPPPPPAKPAATEESQTPEQEEKVKAVKKATTFLQPATEVEKSELLPGGIEILLDGRVYVSSRLLYEVDDHELALRLGRELAHVINGHAFEAHTMRKAATMVADAFSTLCAFVLPEFADFVHVEVLRSVLMPSVTRRRFNRTIMEEADYIGGIFASRARYHPACGLNLLAHEAMHSKPPAVWWSAVTLHRVDNHRYWEFQRRLPELQEVAQHARTHRHWLAQAFDMFPVLHLGGPYLRQHWSQHAERLLVPSRSASDNTLPH
eukprot:TRINITY_DN53643_c0_g1_i1.p1 TRINITY_DN53643_c0_g1~~TRINITY_DN53643_c0_g1_i1.p1  ORF type:complete len:428 (+),score=63.43 TRINITY_DN53643_c0_g1_i1:22-1284(+)